MAEGKGRGPGWAYSGWGLGAPPTSLPRPSSPGAPSAGLLLLIALTGYTVKNARKNDVFFSWSCFSGWLALPFSILAGNLDSGKRVEETARWSPRRPQTPSRPPRDSSPNSAPDTRRPGRSTLGDPSPSPGALPAICPRTNRLPGFCPPFPSRRASAFCWRTGSCRARMPSVDSPCACDRGLPGAE